MKTDIKHLPLALVILDGWGIAPDWGGNAISMAKTEQFHKLWKTMPHTELLASGEAVGLPHGIMGNSEVGHLNIGAGKIVMQFLPMIDELIRDHQFFKNPALVSAMQKAKTTKKTLHLVGILSDGRVHGHINHLFALIQMARDFEVENVAIHAFTDGRDTEPTNGLIFEHQLSEHLKASKGTARVATVSGRFFAMDRDNRWERTLKAYNAIVYGEGPQAKSARDAITDAYTKGMIDEFIEPCVINDKHDGITTMKDDDVVICYNFRADRMRQLARAFVGSDVPMDRGAHPPKIHLYTFTEYQAGLPATVAFNPDPVEKSLADVIADNGLKQFHIAETEKYAHVTYFFNGGNESPESLETRLLIPSPKVLTYDQSPKMAADKITDAVSAKLKTDGADFYVINYANADMVGHTGNIKATIIAVETIDECLGKLWGKVRDAKGTLVITADHGNAEEMINPENGLPDTGHTKNPVPFIICTEDPELQKVTLSPTGGYLGNVAPTILEILDIPKPANMNLQSLIIK